MHAGRLSSLVVIFLCTRIFSVNAEVVEFSATAMQQSPHAPVRIARMYVSKDAVRREFGQNNQQFAEIYYPKKGIHYLLSPANKTYQVVKSTPNPAALRGQPLTSTNPCRDDAEASCRQLGVDNINGLKADKWEIARTIDGRTIKALMWVDKQRGQVLRQFYPDGTVVELVKTGTTVVNDRETEKWELQTRTPDGRQEKTIQWYDPELEMTIKEVLPGGFVRELKDIKTGKQDSTLFSVPSGYKEKKQPQVNPER